MSNNFGKVAVLFGGTSAEREVSLESGTAVFQALLRQGVDAHPVDTQEINGQPHFIDVLRDGGFDAAFIVLHGKNGEDGTIQGLLELLNIPFTGSSVAASALAMDKVRSKLVFQALNLPTPPFAVASNFEQAQQLAKTIGYPISVKPTQEGSSIGVSRVTELSGLLEAFSLASQYGEVMIEKWIEGSDFFVTIIDSVAYPSVQVKIDDGFYDYQAKYKSNDTKYSCPADIPEIKEQELRKIAKDAFESLGCTGWGRVDLVQDKEGKFWVLEVNTVPGMTSHSLVPMSAKAQGIEFDELVINLLSQVSTMSKCVERHKNERGELTAIKPRSECHAADI